MRRAVWRQRDFSLLWGGQTISEIGSQVTVLALPTLAIFTFHAGPAAVGLLVACQRLPFPLLSLPAGVIVDRVRKRPLMNTCNVGRLVILATIPILSAAGALQLWHLFAAAAAMGVFSVFFDLAYLAYIPSLVAADQLLEANSRLEVTWSAGALAGPGLGGLLVQVVGAARAVLVDATSFLLSSLSLLLIGHREVRVAAAARRQMAGELAAGLRHVFGNPVLRSQLLCLTAAGVFAHAYEAPLFVFAYGTLHLSPGLLGAIIASGGAGAIAGSTLASRVIGRVGVGRTMAFTDAITIGLFGFVPLAVFVPPAALLFPLFFIGGGVGTAGNIAQVTLRQSLSPAHLQGRMSAVFRTFFWGAWPLGNVLGGVLAGAMGATTTLWLTALLGVGASFSIVFTPLWRVRDFSAAAPAVRTDAAVPGTR